MLKRTGKTVPTDMIYTTGVTESNKYWYDPNWNPGATAALCLPNCTTYCWGRAQEASGHKLEPYEMLNRTGFGMASNWYGSQGATTWERGQTPKLGAIACWSDDDTHYGGHVAFIEDMGDGTEATIMVSMSGYVRGTGVRSFTNPGDSVPGYFRYMTLAEARDRYERIYYNGTFQGYIYNPYIEDGEDIDIEVLAAIIRRKRKHEC